MPSLQAAGCSMQPMLHFPCAFVVLCILHLTMAMGRLLGELVDREARDVSPLVRHYLQALLSERRTGCSVYTVTSRDDEETANLAQKNLLSAIPRPFPQLCFQMGGITIVPPLPRGPSTKTAFWGGFWHPFFCTGNAKKPFPPVPPIFPLFPNFLAAVLVNDPFLGAFGPCHHCCAARYSQSHGSMGTSSPPAPHPRWMPGTAYKCCVPLQLGSEY